MLNDQAFFLAARLKRSNQWTTVRKKKKKTILDNFNIVPVFYKAQGTI